MNNIVLIGRLTRDPDLQFLPGAGTALCKFTIAVDRRFAKEGQQKTDFIPIQCWGKTAENAANYLTKGRMVGVGGSLQLKSDKQDDGSWKTFVNINAQEIQFLGGNSDNGEKPSSSSNQGFGNGNSTNEPDYGNDVTPVDDDDDIPF